MLYTSMGSEIVLTGRFCAGMYDGRPELLVECHLASGDTGTILLSLSEIHADGGFEEIRKAIFSVQNKNMTREDWIKRAVVLGAPSEDYADTLFLAYGDINNKCDRSPEEIVAEDRKINPFLYPKE